MSGLHPNIEALLAAHGIEGIELPLAHSGYSGARITVIEGPGSRHVMKRMRFADDWIMQFTGDTHCREAEFAASGVGAQLPATTGIATLGAARDGDGWALLMRDVSTSLLPDDGIVRGEVIDSILGGIAQMHAAFWNTADAGVHWCAHRDRLLLLSDDAGQRLRIEGRDFGLIQGWRAFDEMASPRAVELTRQLFADVTPLVRLMESLPQTLVHGDLKLANIALEGGRTVLLDWALVTLGPCALDLMWLHAVNSSRLPWTLDETIERYERHLRDALDARRFVEARWSEQLAVLALSGLLLYGWGKALDAEAGRPDELAWWCERAIAGSRYLP